MSDEQNPFSGPRSPAVALETAPDAQLSGTMLTTLKKTAPWVRFIAILGFIGAGIGVLCGVVFLLGGGAFLTQALASSENAALAAAGVGAALGIIYFGAALLQFFPSFFLYKYSSKLRNYSLTLNNDELESAFKYNKSFWKFSGILVIIVIALTILAIPILAVVSIAGLIAG
jgi:uncharacterized protein involved in cysteine biosynthesis